MISSDENIADRPIRKHFNGIIFSVPGFTAFVLLIAMLSIHFKRPDAGSPPKGAPISRPPPLGLTEWKQPPRYM
jgi:hypothetical protein